MLLERVESSTAKPRVYPRVRKILANRVKKLFPEILKKEPLFLNSCAWCIHGLIKTRVVFFNYLWRNHHEEVLRLDIQLMDASGKELWRQTKNILQDETVVFDSADIAQKIGLKEFEGYLVFSTLSSKVPSIIELLRFNVDYYNDAGAVSTVHDQAIFHDADLSQPHTLGKMEVVENDEIGTTLIFQNALITSDQTVSAKVSVIRFDGQILDIGKFDLPKRKMLRLELGKTKPELQKFLEGKSGHLIVESSCYIKRCAVLHSSKMNPSSWFSVNHSEEYRGNPPYTQQVQTLTAKIGRNGPMVPVVFFHGVDGIHTDLVIFQDVVQAGDQMFGLALYDHDGKLIFQKDDLVKVPACTVRRVPLKDLLPANQSVYGLAQIYIASATFNEKWPAMFTADARYILGNNAWDAQYSQGSAEEQNEKPGIDRTRVFGRVYWNESHKTDLLFFYPSTGEQGKVVDANLRVTLCDPAGKTAISRDLVFKPFSTKWIKMDELFPEVKAFDQKNNPCGVYLRSTDAKVIGVHVTRDKAKASIAADHFYGG